MQDIYKYPIGVKRPGNSKFLNTYQRFFKIPIIGKIFQRKILLSFNLPLETSIMPGFYCSSSLLECGKCCGLGDTHFVAYAPIKIGHHVSFSFHNMVITSTHDFNDFSTVIAKRIEIGDNVWITSNVTILPGVKIGNNTVIGAGSVVAHDIPSGVFAAGNPCEVIKNINFSIEKK